MLNIVLFGPPGSGKGTQSQLLINQYHLIHLSTGDILRGEIARGTELGQKAKSIMDRGDLVPDEVVISMIRSILEKNPNSSMLFYDKDEKIQVRLKVEAIINHNNDITKQSWEKTQHISRKCYLVDNGPGTESDFPTSGLKPELDNFDYTKEQSEEGYKNFTVIQCKIKSIEWLYLAAKGHRRARFDIDNSKDTWLVP